ncbi:MAG: thioredoxin domain-containing protein [Byssovorax sp.]
MRSSPARGLFAAIAISAAACATPPVSGSAPAVRIASRSTDVIRRKGNHLVGEASPYLEQHAHNPVDWYAWGDAATTRAKQEGKLIFLSIGYSTCHWCHVMERESFEDDETARYLNDHFVAIKVDREQRPDLDALFLSAVARLGGSTGWPLTVVLTPDLEPVFGGTYFPKTASGGRLSFLDVLREIEKRYVAEGPELARRGRDVLTQIAAEGQATAGEGEVTPAQIKLAFASLDRSRDATYGGFGSRQKFPTSPLLLAELRFVERTAEPVARAHVTLTLEQMMRGGQRDHLTGTFHRYATDRPWHVPHFERMLYDNAQLAVIYLEAGQALGRVDFTAVGSAAIEDLAASWQRPDGGLVVGFDADDPRGEGVYYTWTPGELQEAIGAPQARLVGALFGVTRAGERSLDGRSVLHRVADEAALAKTLGVAPGEPAAAFDRAFPTLRAIRDARPAPAVDDKELASWNGLALAAFAEGARRLDSPRFLAAAQRTARFLVDTCWNESTRSMSRGVRRGATLGEGFLDDYALPALGLLRLHAADGDPRWLAAARLIGAAIRERFYDERGGVFLQVEAQIGPATLPLRRSETDDGVLPSGSSAATLLFLELGELTGDATFSDAAARVLRGASTRLVGDAFSSGFLLVAADHASSEVREAVIAGDADDPRTRALLRELAPQSDARVLVARVPAAGAPEALIRGFPALEGKKAIGDKPTAFLCKRGACEAPTSDPAALRRALAAF